ncbi:MAG: DUF4011 domain-containing protein [Coriobacteriia bacterium]|nr:DUF4011 domain-containing protein [Coriobacteriia bacterium]
MTEGIDLKIENWRKQLLDLSRRNRLINSAPLAGTSRISRVALAIIEPDPESLWRLIAEDERSLTFPLPDVSADAAASDDEAPNAKPTDTANTSITNQSVADTHKTLRNLRQKARLYSEEKGLNALHLAFGFINWTNLRDGEQLRSPLLLVPVELSQKDLFSPFVLSRHDDEITANHALVQKLEVEAGIVLPQYSDELSLADYVDKITLACASMTCSIELEVELALFSFNKINMYQDLGKHREQLAAHPVVRALAGDASMLNRNITDLNISEFDHDALDPTKVFSVLDGDSSQQDAVQLAKHGASFVLQGPPGTGKSQTITNIIAEFLAEGKKVLFVSEKMAALEVVHRRLTQVGLGDFCLTLHHNNAKRRDILDQLDVSLQLAQSQATVAASAADQLSRLVDQRQRLNNYARQLHSEVRPLGETPFNVYGRLAALQLELGQSSAVNCIPDHAGVYTRQDLINRISLLEDLSRFIAEWGYQDDNPWQGYRPRNLTGNLRQQITSEAETIVRVIASAQSETTGQPDAAAEEQALSPEQQAAAKAIAAQMAMAGHPAITPRNTSALIDELSMYDLNRLSELHHMQTSIEAERQRLAVDYNDQVYSIDGNELLQRCNTRYQGKMRLLNKEYRHDRSLIAATRHDGVKPDFEKIVALAESLKGLQSLELAANSLFDTLGSKQVYNPEFANQLFEQLKEPLSWFADLFDQPERLLAVPLNKAQALVQTCAGSLVLLERYIDYLRLIDRAFPLGITQFVSKLEEQGVPARHILPAFEQCFYNAWLYAVLPYRTAVQEFRRINQDALILSFQKLDKDHLDIAKAATYSRLVSRLPALNTVFSNYDEVGRLRREMSKKRKLMPTRKLIAEIPNLLPVLKPCMMMSPLSVSTFLADLPEPPHNSYLFDIVLFDEASQIRTEDALCAILRARQAIIVGDSKQLPPADFFQSSFSGALDDIYDEQSELGDSGAFESLLDEASLMPTQDLLWHYRSRHESLIAFSNTKLYNNRLTTFPSSLDSADDLGVEYVYVAGAIYERGQRRNLAEANKVADLVFDHIQKHPDRSLGIIAFSESQQATIEETLQQRRRQDPRFEYFFREDSLEPVFIKNLETVQGDERDTIIFSIGYAHDADGRFLMNFGPLSQSGGHRRLNVAITRAKINIKLVGSIMPYDIDLSRVPNEGPHLLRDYIEYAIKGVSTIKQPDEISTTPAPAWSSTGSPTRFEQTIEAFLTNHGFTVDKNVGCSGYRIDFAVRHPHYRNSYCLGIECDGSTYGSARTARDRDRQRPSVLASMGWRMYRVWSADWNRDSLTEGERLLAAIEAAIASYEEFDIKGVLTPPPAAEGWTGGGGEELPLEAAGYESADEDYLQITDRRPEDSDLPQTRFYSRAADTIPLEDIERVMLELVNKSYGIDVEGLYRVTARSYGWARIGSKIRKRLDLAYKKLLYSGKITEANSEQ